MTRLGIISLGHPSCHPSLAYITALPVPGTHLTTSAFGIPDAWGHCGRLGLDPRTELRPALTPESEAAHANLPRASSRLDCDTCMASSARSASLSSLGQARTGSGGPAENHAMGDSARSLPRAPTGTAGQERLRPRRSCLAHRDTAPPAAIAGRRTADSVRKLCASAFSTGLDEI
jgi:hypothetical protein